MKTLSRNHQARLRTLALQPLPPLDDRTVATLEAWCRKDAILRKDTALIKALGGVVRADAADTVWFARELENVDTRIYMAQLIPMVGRLVVPIDRSIPSWATSHRWREFTRFGEAELIASYANQVPMVQVSGAEFIKDIKSYAIAWGWSWKDIETAARTGRPLDIMLATVARQAMERTIDRVLLLGDSRTGAVGYLKMADVPIITATTKTGGGVLWTPAALGTEIVNDILLGCDSIADAMGTGEGLKVNVLMSGKARRRLDRPMTGLVGDAGGKTIYQYLMSNYGDKIERIIESPRNRTAGVGGVSRIMFAPAWRSGEEALTYVFGLLPEEFKTQPGQWADLWWKQVGTASCGGVGNRFPAFFAYMDGTDPA